MSTRAIYSFETEHGGTVHVYKHMDGYPRGAAEALTAAAAFAWPRPRYEGDDFAAAFVAANKMQGGGNVRLIPHGCKPYQFASDAAYRYVISANGQNVIAYKRNYLGDADAETFLFRTSLAGFERRAKAFEKKQETA